MKILLLLTFAFSVYSSEITTQRCRLIHGTGPFKEFTIYYEFLNYGDFDLKKIETQWTKLTFIKNKPSSFKNIVLESSFKNLDTPTLIFKINNIGRWGELEINIGSDQTKKVSALVSFSSESSANRGIYECNKFNKRLFQNLY